MNRLPLEPEVLSRFLSGDASDQEFQRVESILNDPSTVVDLNHQATEDTLIWEIKKLVDNKESLEANDPEVSALIQKINSVVSCPAIGQAELDRVLDPPESNDEIGRIADYRVIEFMASGGMGLVFRAHDPTLDRLVCIKVMHPNLAINDQARQRFEREARAAAKLRNERIVTVFDVGQHRDLPYIVMQLLDGASLAQHLQQHGPIAEQRARKLAMQIAEGLSYAHGLGYLHRDIKPDNIWITEQDDIKLLDFGLARAFDENTRLTNTGTVMGTPSYMSPEQVHGSELDQRSDLFSLGSVIFEMLTGESPFSKANLFSTMMSVAKDSLPADALSDLSELSPALSPVLKQMLEKDPDDRIQTADEVVQILSGQNSMSPAQSQSSAGRGRLRGYLLGALGAAALFFLGMMIWQTTDKGTLVVKADPSVEVKMANETVTVHDPRSGKTWELKIGDQPLPSGVYQLETTDSSGELVFSSTVVTIRRGQEEIVTVTLVPPESTASTNEGGMKAPTKLVSVPPFDVDSLVPMNAAQLSRIGFEAGKPITPAALVENPRPLEGVATWTIEPHYPIGDARQGFKAINRDGSMVATGNARFIRIWNEKLDLLQILPSGPDVQAARWSPANNLLAVIYRGEKSHMRIWRITKDFSELIDTINGDWSTVAWSENGRQIALARRTSQGLDFYQVDDGKLFSLPNNEIAGNISHSPWSGDGRFFATTVTENETPQKKRLMVVIWDIKSGTVHHRFRDASSATWIPNSNQLVIWHRQNRRQNLKTAGIWNVDSLIQVHRLENLGNRAAISPDGNQVANINSNAILSVEDLSGNRSHSFDLSQFIGDASKNIELRERNLHETYSCNWAADGRTLMAESDFGCCLIKLDDSEISGSLSATDSSTVQTATYAGFPVIDNQPSTELLLDNNSLVQFDINNTRKGSSLIGELTGRKIDLASGDVGPGHLMHGSSPLTTSQLTGGGYTADVPNSTTWPWTSKTSENLEWLLIAELKSELGSAKDVTRLTLQPMDKKEHVWQGDINGKVQNIHWCPVNQSFVFVVVSGPTESIGHLNVVAEGGKWDVNLVDLDFSNENQYATEALFLIGGDLFIPSWRIERKGRRPYEADHRLFRMDCKNGEVKSSTELDSKGSFGFMHKGVSRSSGKTVAASPNRVLFVCQQGQLLSVDENGSAQLLKTEAADSTILIQNQSGRRTDRMLDSISNCGKFFVLRQNSQATASFLILIMEIVDGKIAKLRHQVTVDEHHYNSSPPIRWHSKEPVFAVHEYLNLNLVDARTGRRTRSGISAVSGSAPTDDGWAVATPTGLRFLTLDGSPLATILKSGKSDSSNPFSLQWVTASGEIRDHDSARNLRSIYLRGNRFFTKTIGEFEREFGIKVPRMNSPEFTKAAGGND